MYYCHTDGQIVTLVTCVDDILLAGDYEEKVHGMVNCLLERYEGRDLDVPGILILVVLNGTDGGTKLDHVPYTKGIVIE